MRRMRGAVTVLLIQDGTDLDVAYHHGCHGPGDDRKERPEGLGHSRHPHAQHVRAQRAGHPSRVGVPCIAFECPERGGVSVVSVMDPEGDIAALFVEHRDRGGRRPRPHGTRSASIGSRRGAPHAAKRLSPGARRGAPPSNCAGWNSPFPYPGKSAGASAPNPSG